MKLDDNDKAAIAGGRWAGPCDPWNHSQCSSCRAGNLSDHAARNPAPNMRDANVLFSVDEIEARFNSLVEKYDFEH